MKKHFFYTLIFSLLFLCVSCYSTSDMVENPVVIDTRTSLEEKMTALNFPKVNLGQIESFFDGQAWIEKLLELIENSKNYIILTSYLASECTENEKVYNLLCSKAEQGVKVYFLLDSSSSLDMTESKNHLKPLNRLKESGVHMLEYNPFSLNRLLKFTKLFIREHRKIFIFDGETVAVGGMNLNYSSNSAVSAKGQRDSMFCFYSPSAASYLLRNFVLFWNTYSWEEVSLADFANTEHFARTEEGTKTEDITRTEDEEGQTVAWIINQDEFSNTMPSLMGSLFTSAKEEVLILPLLPLEDKNTLNLIKNAVQRGVVVQMILPNDPRKSVYKAAHYSTLKLLETGMQIYTEPDNENTAGLLHEKLIIVDSEYVLIGSVNLNFRSMVLANEVGLLIRDKEFASFMRNHFMKLREGTDFLTEEEAENWNRFFWKLSYLLHFYMG